MPHREQDPLSWLERMLTAAGSVRINGKYQCPSHGTDGEHTVSLRVSRGQDGRALLHCHAGCRHRDVMQALKLPHTALTSALPVEPERYVRLCLPGLSFPAPKDTGGSLEERGLKFEAEHGYGHPPTAWKMRYRNPTTGEKEFRWESLNEKGERVPGLLGRPQADLPLYREADLRHAIGAGEPILLVESESSADALMRAGHYATTWPGGAGDPALERLTEVLGEYRNVVIVPDNDDAGLACRDKLTAQLPAAKVLLPNETEDARDLLARVGADEFRRLVAEQKEPSRDVHLDEPTDDVSEGQAAATVQSAERAGRAAEHEGARAPGSRSDGAGFESFEGRIPRQTGPETATAADVKHAPVDVAAQPAVESVESVETAGQEAAAVSTAQADVPDHRVHDDHVSRFPPMGPETGNVADHPTTGRQQPSVRDLVARPALPTPRQSWDAVNAAHAAVTQLRQQRAADHHAEHAAHWAYQQDAGRDNGACLERGL